VGLELPDTGGEGRLTRLLQRTRKLRFPAAEQHTRYAAKIAGATKVNGEHMATRVASYYAPLLVLLTLAHASAPLARAQSTERKTLVEVSTKSGEVVRLELWDVVPSLRGTALLSLTKKPSENLESIVWFAIPIRPYQKQTSKVTEIRVTGEPLAYRYPRSVEDTLFFPITLITSDGNSEKWFWQGKSLSGLAKTKGSTPARVDISIANVSVIRFLGPS
jgi:hypothetical protein